jgi:hypothetical protein
MLKKPFKNYFLRLKTLRDPLNPVFQATLYTHFNLATTQARLEITTDHTTSVLTLRDI